MPTRARKVCSEGGCNTIAPPGRSKCDEHRRQADARSRTAPRPKAWYRLSRRVVREHVERHGWLCPGYLVPGHRVDPGGLVGDHVRPLSQGGELLDEANVQVLCVRCNARRGAR